MSKERLQNMTVATLGLATLVAFAYAIYRVERDGAFRVGSDAVHVEIKKAAP